VHQRYEVLCTDPALLSEHKEQLQMAWIKLLAQFFSVKNDTTACQYAAILGEMELILFRTQLIRLFTDRLEVVGHNPPLIAALKAFTGYSDLSFESDNMGQCLHQLCIREKRYQTVYDGMKQELKRMQQAHAKPTEKDFYKTVMLYNKVNQTRHQVKDLSAYEYALMCEELEQSNS